MQNKKKYLSAIIISDFKMNPKSVEYYRIIFVPIWKLNSNLLFVTIEDLKQTTLKDWIASKES